MDNTNTQTTQTDDLKQALQLAQELKEANDKFEKESVMAIADLEKEADELEKEFAAAEIDLTAIEKKGSNDIDEALLQFMLEEDELSDKEAAEDALEPPEEN